MQTEVKGCDGSVQPRLIKDQKGKAICPNLKILKIPRKYIFASLKA